VFTTSRNPSSRSASVPTVGSVGPSGVGNTVAIRPAGQRRFRRCTRTWS